MLLPHFSDATYEKKAILLKPVIKSIISLFPHELFMFLSILSVSLIFLSHLVLRSLGACTRSGCQEHWGKCSPSSLKNFYSKHYFFGFKVPFQFWKPLCCLLSAPIRVVPLQVKTATYISLFSDAELLIPEKANLKSSVAVLVNDQHACLVHMLQTFGNSRQNTTQHYRCWPLPPKSNKIP